VSSLVGNSILVAERIARMRREMGYGEDVQQCIYLNVQVSIHIVF
jgi:hypothetical protein